MECSQCQSKNIIIDDSRAEIICEDCGAVSEQTDIQKETEFEELDNGRIAAIGHVISTGTNASKQNTINKASNLIQNLCAKLALTKSLASYAISIFESALQIRMTRSRSRSVTAGACVYLAARIKQQSLMLLDVSDKLNINVYILGKTYNELREKTGQRVSDVDPCLFIDRFAMELELGDKTSEVATTALKLLQRMKKDWISTGRRPTGITAAALLIAARLHGFDRDCSDVARIAGVSNHTAKKRLQEWAQTSTADLTLAQFSKIEYEDEFDPPAFTNQKMEDHLAEKLSDEDFERFRMEMNGLRNQLEEERVANKREKLTETYYKHLMESVETGEVDLEALIGTLEGDSDNEDLMTEIEGRKELLGDCLGMREVLQSLSKREAVVSASAGRRKEDQLPVSLPELVESDSEGRWPPRGSGPPPDDEDDMDEDELERVYICSREEAYMKYEWWIKRNPGYYKKQKKSAEKRLLKRKSESESGKKTRSRRQKRYQEHMLDTEELLRDIKACLPPVKRQRTMADEEEDRGGDEGGGVVTIEGEEEERGELYKSEHRDDDEGQEEEPESEEEEEEHIQYDYNEDE